MTALASLFGLFGQHQIVQMEPAATFEPGLLSFGRPTCRSTQPMPVSCPAGAEVKGVIARTESKVLLD